MRLARLAAPATLALALLTAPLAADAQPAKVPRVGYVFGLSSSESRHLLEAFRRGLRELGYVEGQNVALEERWAEGRSDRLPGLVAELVRLPVDVLVVESGLAGLAAKKATQTIPIVMAPVGDPVGSGLVASLGRPGGNTTGVSLFAPDLSGKRLELLLEAVPEVSRVGVLWNPANPNSAAQLRQTEVAARALGVTLLQPLGVRGLDEFASAFSALVNQRAEALNVLADGLFLTHRKRIAELAIKGRLPAPSLA